MSFKPHSLELSWCVYWVIASHSQVVIKDLRLIPAQSTRHANLDTSRSFENSSISSPVGQRAAFHAEMVLLIPPACCLLVLRSIPFGFGLGLVPSPCTFLQSSPPSSETSVPRCDGPPGAWSESPRCAPCCPYQICRPVSEKGRARPTVWRHLWMLHTQCNPVDVTHAGLSF